VAVSATHAYVADAEFGLQVIDITNPQSPNVVGSRNTPGSAQDVAIRGGLAYVADEASGLRVIDVTNPQSPVGVGSVDTPHSASSVVVEGAYAYVADNGSGLQVIDITNSQNPEIVGGVSTIGAADAVVVSGGLVYVGAKDSPDYLGALLVLPTQCDATTSAGHDGAVQGSDHAGALSAWPNPSIGSVSLRYAIPSGEIPSLRIYDVSGRHIRTLVTESRSSAEQQLLWDGKDDQGRSVASGTYFVRLQWAQGSATSRVMLLR
jgi:hypothetical protein